jgi:uncharacterized UBP type Zn finger protein
MVLLFATHLRFATSGVRYDGGNMTSTCAHLLDLEEVTPHTQGCEECLQSGSQWIHLRLCLNCGHVGCCDSSPNKHATAHHHSTNHPVIQSFQPGEDWMYCYEDDLVMTPA